MFISAIAVTSSTPLSFSPVNSYQQGTQLYRSRSINGVWKLRGTEIPSVYSLVPSSITFVRSVNIKFSRILTFPTSHILQSSSTSIFIHASERLSSPAETMPSEILGHKIGSMGYSLMGKYTPPSIYQYSTVLIPLQVSHGGPRPSPKKTPLPPCALLWPRTPTCGTAASSTARRGTTRSPC
jgi:hypothetical protein